MSEQDLTNAIDILIIVAILVVFLTIYFLPSIIAIIRKHSHKFAVFFLNLFTGATGAGWIAAFVWAFADKSNTQVKGKQTTTQKLKDLAQPKEQGIITEEEFKTRKNNMLNS